MVRNVLIFTAILVSDWDVVLIWIEGEELVPVLFLMRRCLLMLCRLCEDKWLWFTLNVNHLQTSGIDLLDLLVQRVDVSLQLESGCSFSLLIKVHGFWSLALERCLLWHGRFPLSLSSSLGSVRIIEINLSGIVSSICNVLTGWSDRVGDALQFAWFIGITSDAALILCSVVVCRSAVVCGSFVRICVLIKLDERFC